MTTEKVFEVRIRYPPSLADINRPKIAVPDPMANRRLADPQAISHFLHRLISILWHHMAPFSVLWRKIAADHHKWLI